MATLKKTRGAQYPLVAEFVFNFDDTAVDSVSGASKTFGAVFADDIVFDCIPLPVGAQVIGGDLIVETQGVGPTAYTAKVGVSGADACFLAASDLLAAANTRYALLLTSEEAGNTGKDVRLTISSTVANATAGKARLRVMYTIDGRVNEVQTT